ncbi:MAG: hypothetical protein EZS28_029045 [Streblomastix strix]|uniref:Uncharacterized protein n=1 Tax=Streblomastix strix TaxID=222440 RepID=A0A5J4UYY8_9EUKA|nr:MAG: hypothetical protein EZS28_029045 [Streblomastix strix]
MINNENMMMTSIFRELDCVTGDGNSKFGEDLIRICLSFTEQVFPTIVNEFQTLRLPIVECAFCLFSHCPFAIFVQESASNC